MLKSKELRLKAWDSLKGKYWTAFLVSLVTGIVFSLGGLCITLIQFISGISGEIFSGDVEAIAKSSANVICIVAIAAVVGLLISFFIGNLAMIGCCNYYIKNACSDAKPSMSDAFSPYKTRYGRNVGALIVMDIKVILWTLLFIVPGIIKAFEYSVVPYILADDDQISSKEAFKKAREMMKGNKWRLFKLNFSFIGWSLLSILTLGIGTLFLAPYIDAANAEFYVELKNKNNI